MASSEVFHYSIPSVQDTGTGAIENGQSIDSNKLEIRSDQLLVSKLNPRKQTIVLARPHPDNRTVASTEFVPLIPKKVELEYLALIFGSEAMRLNLSSKVESVTRSHQRVNPREIENPSIPLPPDSERARIVTQVTASTARIDALIEKKTRFIELLKEKRQALITQAVTKGLDSTVPMKDSGVEWIGEVPAHWEVVRVKHVTLRIEQGWSPQCENQPADDDEWAVLKVGCVNGGVFNKRENKALPAELKPVPALSLKANDLLVSRANTRELVGSAAVVQADQPKIMLCDKLYRLKIDESSAAPEFIAHMLATGRARGQIELDANGASSSMLNIGQRVIMEMALGMPSREEQDDILKFLRSQLSRIDNLNSSTNRSIDLLKERRSALITAAVTGQIDLREEE